MHSYDEPVYMISVVAKVLEIHPQTLRQYEREGLILPGRSEGRVRLYSQRNIDEIRTVLRLTRDMGVNLAGVDVALKLQREIAKLEDEIALLKSRLEKVNEQGLVPLGKQVVVAKGTKVIIVEG